MNMSECKNFSNFDIHAIDKKINELITQNLSSLEKINKEIENLNDIITSTELKSHIKRDIEEQICNLNQRKKTITDLELNHQFYIMDYTCLMQKYNTILYQPKNIFFMSKDKDTSQDLSAIFQEYIQILKKYNIFEYIEKDISTQENNEKKEKKKKCKNCKSREFIYNSDHSVEICIICGVQEDKDPGLIQYKDSTRINGSNKYNYERRIHFRDSMNCWQGKQNSFIDPQIYKDLEKELESHNLLIKSNNKKIRFEKVTKDHILFFLKETKHSKHYEDVVLIYHNLTGKPIDDISHLENVLMEDFDKVSDVYDKLFKFSGKVQRKSFINTQYVFFQLLKRHKHPCDKNQFNMLKTLDRKSFHDTVLQTIFTYLGWNFQSMF
jgi:hypothetical protein